MDTVVLVIHLVFALAIIVLVLLQRSEGGGLGIGGGGGGLGAFASAQSTANALTRLTAIFAALFFLTSLVLGILANQKTGAQNIIDAALRENVPAVVQESDVNTTEQEQPLEAVAADEAPVPPVDDESAAVPEIPIE